MPERFTETLRTASEAGWSHAALALGTWAGLKSFGRLDEAGFRRVVLGLLLLSGVSLLFRAG